jgi:hypothetical protein
MGGSVVVVVVGSVLVVVVLDVLVVVVLVVVVLVAVLLATVVVGTVEAPGGELDRVRGAVVTADVPPLGNEGPAGLAFALT